MDGQERTRRLGELEQQYLWDPLQRYLGPTGIPDRLRGLVTLAGEVSPSTAVMRSMQGAGRAANPDLLPGERLSSGLESLVEAGTVVAPAAIVGRAANLARASRGMQPSATASGAQALDEALLGAGAVGDVQQELFDQSRRNFLKGAGAAALASRLPSEDLLADTGRYLDEVARPASRLPELASALSKRLEIEMDAVARIEGWGRYLDEMVRPDQPPPVLVIPEKARHIERAAEERAAGRVFLGPPQMFDSTGRSYFEILGARMDQDTLSDLLSGVGPTTPEDVARLSDDELRVLERALTRHSKDARQKHINEVSDSLQRGGYLEDAMEALKNENYDDLYDDEFFAPHEQLFFDYLRADPESLSQLDTLSETAQSAMSRRGLSPLRDIHPVPLQFLGDSK